VPSAPFGAAQHVDGGPSGDVSRVNKNLDWGLPYPALTESTGATAAGLRASCSDASRPSALASHASAVPRVHPSNTLRGRDEPCHRGHSYPVELATATATAWRPVLSSTTATCRTGTPSDRRSRTASPTSSPTRELGGGAHPALDHLPQLVGQLVPHVIGSCGAGSGAITGRSNTSRTPAASALDPSSTASTGRVVSNPHSRSPTSSSRTRVVYCAVAVRTDWKKPLRCGSCHAALVNPRGHGEVFDLLGRHRPRGGPPDPGGPGVALRMQLNVLHVVVLPVAVPSPQLEARDRAGRRVRHVSLAAVDGAVLAALCGRVACRSNPVR